MKIGIGITSYKRPEHLKLCLWQIWKHTSLYLVDKWKLSNGEYPIKCGSQQHPYEFIIHVAKDIPNIAKAKNECLYNLRDCDHIFLFDDDCFPIKDGWVDWYINNGDKHQLYLTERHGQYSGFVSSIGYYRDCGGCFIYLDKETFERVGYFNTEYRQYGFEHCSYSKRIGLGYRSLNGTNEYIYSLDYQGEGNWGVKHKPSITDYKAMQESIDYNRKVFEKEITSDKIYYDYEP